MMPVDGQPIANTNQTIFVIDDDASVRNGISVLLDAMGFFTETFTSAEEFLARERYEGTGCIILDVSMPGLTGMDLQDELVRTGYRMPIVFITGHGSIPMGITAMKKGASDFLSKPFDDEELRQAVVNAITKHEKIRKAECEAGDALQRLKLLTGREYEIFRHIIKGMLNKQIGYSLGIAEITVKIHRGRIMEKLQANSVVDLVRLAEKAGVQPAGGRGNV